MSTLTFNLKMFDPKKKLIVVCSEGYESIIHHNHEFIEMVYYSNKIISIILYYLFKLL
jgi:hypothetical protein